MGWFDDLQARVSDFQDTDLGNTISDYVSNRVVDAVVKIGDQPTGNLTAAQIQGGARGGTAPVVASPVATMIPSSSSSAMMKILPFMALGLVAYLVLQKKSRS